MFVPLYSTTDKSAAAAMPAYIPRAVFGVSLEESLDVAQIASLPAIVFRCIQYLEAKKAEQEEGIYRLSGSSAVIKSLKDRFNAGAVYVCPPSSMFDIDCCICRGRRRPAGIRRLLGSARHCWTAQDIPQGTARKHPDARSALALPLCHRYASYFLPVCPNATQLTRYTGPDFVDPQERIKELSHLISSLPVANYSLLRALTAHLILIVQNANINKMTMRNVGIVFSPTLGIPAGVFSLMLGEFKRVFNVDGTLDEPVAPVDSEEAHTQSAARRNSQHYSEAAADQMLGLVGRTLPGTLFASSPPPHA